MVDNIESFHAQMSEKGVSVTQVHEERWGHLVDITLPGGGAIGVYEPKHERPLAG